MAIDRLITNIKFKGLKSLKIKREIIKKKDKVKEKAILILKNILNKKKKNKLIITCIVMIIKRLEGVVRKVNKIIELTINNKKAIFFPNLSLASLICFYYNEKL
jgi:hypothetical protein